MNGSENFFSHNCVLCFLDRGYFMHLDTKSGHAGQSALLESRILYPRKKEKCLQFFYRLNGSPQDKLVIWVKKDDGTGNVRRMEKLHTITGKWKCGFIAEVLATLMRDNTGVVYCMKVCSSVQCKSNLNLLQLSNSRVSAHENRLWLRAVSLRLFPD